MNEIVLFENLAQYPSEKFTGRWRPWLVDDVLGRALLDNEAIF